MLPILLCSMTMSTTTKSVNEYDITFAVKEWLIKHSWNVIAFNPPGAQGSFTIPNPAKDPRYRGQTGSEAPDIIAVKNRNLVLIVESKPLYNKKDTEKLLNLYKNKERMKLLLQLVENACLANEVPFQKPVKVILARAHSGKNNIRMKIQTFLVSVADKWNPGIIDPIVNPFNFMKVIVKGTNKVVIKLLRT